MAEADGPTRGHSLNDVTAAIAEANKTAYQLEQRIYDLIEKHVQDSKDELTKLWRTTKADTKIDIKVLKAYYKIYKMALDASIEEEGGDETTDMLRIGFEGLQRGGQLDWLNAVTVTHREGEAPGFVGQSDDDSD